MLAPAQNTRSLPLHGVAELDVDAKIIGIEFELVALEQARILVDIHDQLGHVAVELELPVAITRGLGLEIDAVCHGAGLLPISHAFLWSRAGHNVPLPGHDGRSHAIMHYYSTCVPDDA
jgi:hypothetical protein